LTICSSVMCDSV